MIKRWKNETTAQKRKKYYYLKIKLYDIKHAEKQVITYLILEEAKIEIYESSRWIVFLLTFLGGISKAASISQNYDF